MTTSYGPAQGPPVPPGHWPPPVVSMAAHEHQLGGHLATRRISTPVGPLVTGIVGAFGLLVLGFVLLGVAQAIGPLNGLFWLVRGLAGASCLGFVLLITRTIRASTGQRPESYYVYEGGLVHLDGTSPRVLAWSEVRQVRAVTAPEGARAGQVTHYSVVRQGYGMPVSVPVDLQQGPDPFGEHLVAAARARGIEVR